MNYSHIVWDFNGTILDDVDTGIVSVNTMLAARGIKTLASREEYHSYFGFPIKDYYARIGFDFEKESYDVLAIEWVELYNKNYSLSHIRDGFTTVADYLARCGVSQLVISASELNMLTKQIDDLGIIGYFDSINGLDNIHAGSKLDIAKAWFDTAKPADALFIGDTTHDYECAKEIGCDCVLIAGGHMSYDTLLGCGCPVMRSFEELNEYLKEQ